MSQLLSDAWNSYERDILDPANASQTQRVECRRVFYAGAQTMFHLLEGVQNGDEVDEQEAFTPRELQDELEAFVLKVTEGLA